LIEIRFDFVNTIRAHCGLDPALDLGLGQVCIQNKIVRVYVAALLDAVRLRNVTAPVVSRHPPVNPADDIREGLVCGINIKPGKLPTVIVGQGILSKMIYNRLMATQPRQKNGKNNISVQTCLINPVIFFWGKDCWVKQKVSYI